MKNKILEKKSLSAVRVDGKAGGGRDNISRVF
jgi:hypothetical protein